MTESAVDLLRKAVAFFNEEPEVVVSAIKTPLVAVALFNKTRAMRADGQSPALRLNHRGRPVLVDLNAGEWRIAQRLGFTRVQR